MKLQVIVGTTREGRQTEKIAKWVANDATAIDGVTAEIVDLADYPMPFFDEPISPRYNPNRVINPEVKKWLDKISEADAYVFVTPEYNHSIAAVLKNALDYVTYELAKKPATVVAHGTVGGARATVQLKEILSESQAAIIPKAVAFAGAGQSIDDDGVLDAEAKARPYGPETQLAATLEELKWYSDALAAARG
jgi:NAD(P)H-dependent FMN reductase